MYICITENRIYRSLIGRNVCFTINVKTNQLHKESNNNNNIGAQEIHTYIYNFLPSRPKRKAFSQFYFASTKATNFKR